MEQYFVNQCNCFKPNSGVDMAAYKRNITKLRLIGIKTQVKLIISLLMFFWFTDLIDEALFKHEIWLDD
jgi:hypothetical protein